MTARPEATGRYLCGLLDRDFTAEQLAVVTAPLAPQLVVAGAGSGKTTVMAARVVHAVAYHGLPPGAVLGLTFTNKAAVELADRVRAALATLTGPGGLLPEEALDDPPTVSTYHAYAAGLVRDHALRIGREPDTTLLTEARRWQVALRVVRAARGPYPHLDLGTATVAQYVLDLDGEMSEHLVDPDAVRHCDAALEAAVDAVAAVRRPTKAVLEVRDHARVREELLGLVLAYRARKRELDLVDFGDQVALAARIAAQCPEVGTGERARFGVVFLDEYQDTGVGQRELLSRLFGGGHPVTAVGDPCQSIYGWRGASVGNLLRFGEHFPAADGAAGRHHLLTSFRNDGRILDVANVLSAPLRTGAAAHRAAVDVPHLRPRDGRAGEGSVRLALHPTVVDEAGWVADEIAAAVADGAAPGDIAVLCRRRSDFPLFHGELVARDVPVEVVGLGGLLEMPEVADVVAVLEVLADPTANPALLRILTGPRYRIGPRDLAALGQRAAALAVDGGGRVPVDPDADPDGTLALQAASGSVDPCDVVALTDALADPGDGTAYSPAAVLRLRALQAELDRLRPVVGSPVVEAVSEVVRAIGLDVELEAAPVETGGPRLANLAAFLDHAARYEGLEGDADVPGFLGYLRAAQDQENGLDVGGVSATDSVKLLTVHKAKGLEWEMVAVPCLAQDTFPAKNGRSRWTSAGRVLPTRLRGDCADLPPDPELSGAGLGRYTDLCKADDLAEERRLAYVAVTRARARLLLSGHRWNLTRKTPCKISVFLQDAADACGAGAGEIVGWTDEAGPANPLLSAGSDPTPWPAPYEPAALARRRAVAQEVRGLSGAGADDDAADMTAVAGPDRPATAGPDRPATAAAASGRPTAAALRWETDKLLEELERERDLTRLVPLPRTLTASQVVRLAEDPAGLARSLVRPMPRRPSPAARRGTSFHSWLQERAAVRPLLDPADLPGAGDPAAPDDGDLAALQAAFARSPYADLAPHAVEAPFELAVGGWLLRGRIDAVYRVDGGYDVVDWKTGLSPVLSAAAALQLAVYRLAWAGITGEPPDRVGAAFLYLRTGRLTRPEGLPDLAGLERLLTGEGAA